MAASRGANLVGMSTMSLDACPFSLLIKNKNLFNCKKKKLQVYVNYNFVTSLYEIYIFTCLWEYANNFFTGVCQYMFIICYNFMWTLYLHIYGNMPVIFCFYGSMSLYVYILLKDFVNSIFTCLQEYVSNFFYGSMSEYVYILLQVYVNSIFYIR